MPSKRIKEHLPLLQYLAKGKPKIRKAIIEESDSDVMKVLCECAANTINGNVKLPPSHFKKLKRYKKQLRLLSNKKVGVKQKKKVLQTGGFLGALLNAVLPTLAGLVGSLFSK